MFDQPRTEGLRDLVGYGRDTPSQVWPNGARIAVNFNLNFEGGGESTLYNGDAGSEGMLNDIGYPAKTGVRVPLVESIFEYGSRCGVWRVLDCFRKHDVRASILGVGRALEQSPEAARAFVAEGHELVSHGYRWIDYCDVDEATERAHIREAARIIADLTGEAPTGWMTGRPGPNTRRLLAEDGRFSYDRDCLGDELPYWQMAAGKPHLVIPYSYETNDNRFNENAGFSTADDFFTYMRDAFDVLYDEGATRPKLLSIGLHDRLIGRPGRILGLDRLLTHIRSRQDVWICTGAQIAEHWHKSFPPVENAIG